MLLSRLLVELGLKDNLAPGLDKSKKGVKEWAESIGRVGKVMTASVTTPVVGGFVKMIQGASDLKEATDAANITFGKYGKSIVKTSKSAAEVFGLSQAQYLSAATAIGVFGKSAGLGEAALGDFANQTIRASSDLASFYNVSQSDALEAITAGIRGEYDGLDRLGIVLNEAAVNQYAWTHGIAENGKELTEQQKILARQGAIMDQYNKGPAKDNFKISDGLAKHWSIFRAQLSDTAAIFGQAILPMATKFAKSAATLLKRIQKLSPAQKKWVVVLAAVAAAIGPILIGLSAMLPALAVLTGPIGLIVLALTGLGIAYKTNLLGFGDAVDWVAGKVGSFVQGMITFGKAMVGAVGSSKGIRDLMQQFPAPLRQTVRGFLLIADAIGDIVRAWRGRGFDHMLEVLPAALRQVRDGARLLGKELFQLGTKAFRALADAIAGIDWGAVWGTVKDFGSGIIGKLGDITSGLVDWMRGQIDAVDWSTVWTKTVEFGEIAINGLLKLADKLLQVSKDFGGWLKPQLLGAWDGSINIGIVTIIITGFKIGGAALLSIPIELIKGINGLDTSGVGESLGRKLAENPIALVTSGILLAGKLYEGFTKGIKKIPAKLWIAPLLALAPIAMGIAGLTFVALAIKKAGEFMIGFAKGITNSWRVYPLPIIRALPTLAQAAIGGVLSGPRSLVQKGRDLIQGMRDGIDGKWSSVAVWFLGVGPRARRAIPDISESLLHKGEDLIIGLWDGAQAMWESAYGVAGWLLGLGDEAAGYVADAARNAYNALWQAGFALFQPVYAGMLWVWDNLIQPLIDKIPDWIPGFGGSQSTAAVSRAAVDSTFAAQTASSLVGVTGPAMSGQAPNVTNTFYISNPDPQATATIVMNKINREWRLA